MLIYTEEEQYGAKLVLIIVGPCTEYKLIVVI